MNLLQVSQIALEMILAIFSAPVLPEADQQHGPQYGPIILSLHKEYLEGHGDLVSRLIMGIIGVTIRVIWIINLFTKPP